MKILKNIAILFWRLWFYAWMIGTIIIGFPVLLVTTSKESWYPAFYKVARCWAKTILFVMGFRISTTYEEELALNRSYMLCANHTSMIDVFMMLAIIKNPFVFVGKAELAKIPIFGFFYKRTCILVDRDNPKSRKAVFVQAQKRLNQGLSVCIFPEGQVPEDETIILDEFKNGAFILALEHQIPIVPMAFYDCKKRFSYTFFSGSPGLLRAKVHQPINTENKSVKDKNILKDTVYDLLYKELKSELY